MTNTAKYGYWQSFSDWGPNTATDKKGVQDFFIECSRMYFNEYHVDGIRFDATKAYSGEGLKNIVKGIKYSYPEKYIISEHLGTRDGDNPWLIDTVKFDGVWDDIAYKCFKAAIDGKDIENAKKAIGYYQSGKSTSAIKYFTGSHDEVWIKSSDDRYNNGKGAYVHLMDNIKGRDSWDARAKVRMAYAANVFSIGTPMSFMGTEGYANWHGKRNINGKDVDLNGWHNYYGMNWAEALEEGDSSVGKQMRTMIAHANAARLGNSAFFNTNIDWVQNDYTNKIFAYKKWDNNGNIVLVVINLGENSFGSHNYGLSTGNTQGEWTQVFSSQNWRYGGWSGSDMEGQNKWTQGDGKIYINVPKLGVMVFRKK